MIKYLKHHEINKTKWDNCIHQSFNGIIYAYSWYLDVICSNNWEALVEDDYKTVMPLNTGCKIGLNYIFQPFFAQQLGVFSTGKLSEEIIFQFLNFIPAKYRLIEMNLNTFNNLSSHSFSIKPQLTYELDLIGSYENLYSEFSENTKRNIKKASKNELSITKDVNINELIEIFRKSKGKSVNLKNNHYETLKQLIRICVHKGKAHIWGVRKSRNELIAGVVFLESNGKTIYFVSGANEEAKRLGAISFLVDRFIFENSQRNLTLDFEGSNIPSLARFYKSFGSKECVYLQVKKNNLPLLIKWLKK